MFSSGGRWIFSFLVYLWEVFHFYADLLLGEVAAYRYNIKKTLAVKSEENDLIWASESQSIFSATF